MRARATHLLLVVVAGLWVAGCHREDEVGEAGAPGVSGERGPAGPAGESGPEGEPGPGGPAGVQGPAGSVSAGDGGEVVGPTGAPGDGRRIVTIDGGSLHLDGGVVVVAGPQGAMGAPGAAGGVGAMGPPGAAGATGSAGTSAQLSALPPGAQCPNGGVLVAGAGGGFPACSGASGANGPVGAVGPPGPAGGQGPQGAAGVVGASGPAGATGSTGPVGPGGVQGAVGASGAAGPPASDRTYGSEQLLDCNLGGQPVGLLPCDKGLDARVSAVPARSLAQSVVCQAVGSVVVTMPALPTGSTACDTGAYGLNLRLVGAAGGGSAPVSVNSGPMGFGVTRVVPFSIEGAFELPAAVSGSFSLRVAQGLDPVRAYSSLGTCVSAMTLPYTVQWGPVAFGCWASDL